MIYKCVVNAGDDGICMKSSGARPGGAALDDVIVAGCTVLRAHGGFVLGSARSSLATSGYMATDTGRRVISVDYTVAPKGQWPLVTDQIIGVYKAVLASGVP